MKTLIRSLIYILFLSSLIAVSGCATIPYVPPPAPPEVPGIYHEVRGGETLWKISKAYDVDLREVARLNKLPDASRINRGQMIFIPYADTRLDAGATQASKDSFIWPVKGNVISFFGSTKDGIKNKGIDIATGSGIIVRAAKAGKVNFRDDRVKGYGKTIILDHGDSFTTVYAFNSELIANIGDYVKQGGVIARTGNTGRAKVPSLHFEIRKAHNPENPFYYLP